MAQHPCALSRATCLHRVRQHLQNAHAVIPADAGDGDALAVSQLCHVIFAGRELLGAIDEVTFDHDTENLARTAADLRCDVFGHVDLAFLSLSSVVPQLKAKRLRALAITSAKRSALMPELPTFAEAGLPGFESTAWFAVLAPARTPEAVIARLNGEIRRLLQLTDVREKLQGQGAELQPGTPADLDRRIRLELDKWAKIIKASGAKVD